MTTRYVEAEFLTSHMGICHETGHALYEQGLPLSWIDQPVGNVQSMAMHESQSLLIEMEVCRSLAFANYLTPQIQTYFGQQEAFTGDNIHNLMTRVKPGLIRVDADEVTYPLHVILRYEIEKKLFNEEIGLQDLPTVWNESMSYYLGVSPETNDAMGVMQDVHWPSGAFGYFPAYTLGRLMAAQLFSTYTQAHTHFEKEFASGNFSLLKSWLLKNVYSKGSLLSAQDLLLQLTGEKLSCHCFLEGINKRYLT